jgi:hypothetical protein
VGNARLAFLFIFLYVLNLVSLVGTSAFYYDTVGGEIYFDKDGDSTDTFARTVAQLTLQFGNAFAITQLVIAA